MHLATLIDEDAVERTKRPAQGESTGAPAVASILAQPKGQEYHRATEGPPVPRDGSKRPGRLAARTPGPEAMLAEIRLGPRRIPVRSLLDAKTPLYAHEGRH
jgi:hypothetical protein